VRREEGAMLYAVLLLLFLMLGLGGLTIALVATERI
jgi:hypothetical protein